MKSPDTVILSFPLGTIATTDSTRNLFRADRTYKLVSVWMWTGATIDDHESGKKIDLALVDQTNTKTLTSALSTYAGAGVASFTAYVPQQATVVYETVPAGAVLALFADATGDLSGLDAVSEFTVQVELYPVT